MPVIGKTTLNNAKEFLAIRKPGEMSLLELPRLCQQLKIQVAPQSKVFADGSKRHLKLLSFLLRNNDDVLPTTTTTSSSSSHQKMKSEGSALLRLSIVLEYGLEKYFFQNKLYKQAPKLSMQGASNSSGGGELISALLASTAYSQLFHEHFGIFWNLIKSFGILLNVLYSFGIFWIFLESFAFCWNLFDYFGIFLILLDLLRTFWNLLDFSIFLGVAQSALDLRSVVFCGSLWIIWLSIVEHC